MKNSTKLLGFLGSNSFRKTANKKSSVNIFKCSDMIVNASLSVNPLKKFLTILSFLFLTMISTFNAYAQPSAMSNNTDCNGTYSNKAMTAVGTGSNNTVFIIITIK
jgi:hypothetical protein